MLLVRRFDITIPVCDNNGIQLSVSINTSLYGQSLFPTLAYVGFRKRS